MVTAAKGSLATRWSAEEAAKYLQGRLAADESVLGIADALVDNYIPATRNPHRHFLRYARHRAAAPFPQLISAWETVAKSAPPSQKTLRTRTWLSDVVGAALLRREFDTGSDISTLGTNETITLAGFAKRINRLMRKNGWSAKRAHREALALVTTVLEETAGKGRTVRILRDHCKRRFDQESRKLCRRRTLGRPRKSILAGLVGELRRLEQSFDKLGPPHSSRTYARLQQEDRADVSSCVAVLDDVIDRATVLQDVLDEIEKPPEAVDEIHRSKGHRRGRRRGHRGRRSLRCADACRVPRRPFAKHRQPS